MGRFPHSLLDWLGVRFLFWRYGSEFCQLGPQSRRFLVRVAQSPGILCGCDFAPVWASLSPFSWSSFSRRPATRRNLASSKLNYDLIAPVELIIAGRVATACLSVASVVLGGTIGARFAGNRPRLGGDAFNGSVSGARYPRVDCYSRYLRNFFCACSSLLLRGHPNGNGQDDLARRGARRSSDRACLCLKVPRRDRRHSCCYN